MTTKMRRDIGRADRYASPKDGMAPAIPWLTSVKPVPRNRLVRGAVVWARVAFVDGSGDKVRPAVVEGVCGRDIRVRPATTSIRRHRLAHGYTELIDLEEAGLARPTGISIVSIVIDRMDVISVVGELAPVDELRVLGDASDRAQEGVQVAG